MPGTIGTPASCISSRALVLEPIASIARRGRPDERDARLLEPPREGGVLGQEAVAGMDRLGPGALDHLEQLVDVEVGLGGRARTEQMSLGGPLDVLRVAVGLGVHGDRFDPELVERSDDPDGDLAAVGDQDPCKHEGRAMLSARLILVRHGQSTYNAQARLQGQADPELSDAGRAEAQLLRARFTASRLERVIDERSAAGERDRGDPRLPGRAARRALPRDRVGAWAGRPLSDFPDETEYAWRGGELHAPGGESWPELVRRGSAAPSTSCSPRVGTWLVVCHGGVVRAALSHVTGADPRSVAGPGERQRHGDPGRGRPRLEALRLDAGRRQRSDVQSNSPQVLGEGPVFDRTPPHPGAFEGRYKWEPAGRHNGAAVPAGYPTPAPGAAGSRSTPSSLAARTHGLTAVGRSAAGGGAVSRRNCSIAAITAAASSGEAVLPWSSRRGRRFMRESTWHGPPHTA